LLPAFCERRFVELELPVTRPASRQDPRGEKMEHPADIF
jgi:hypothetical protein